MKKSMKITAGVAAGVVGIAIIGGVAAGGESEPVQTADTTEVVEAKAEANAKPPQPEYDVPALSEWAGETATIFAKAGEATGRVSDCPTYSVTEFNECTRDIALDLWTISRELTVHVNAGKSISMPPACERLVKQTGLVAKRMDQTGDELAGGVTNVDAFVTASKRYMSAMGTATKMAKTCTAAAAK